MKREEPARHSPPPPRRVNTRNDAIVTKTTRTRVRAHRRTARRNRLHHSPHLRCTQHCPSPSTAGTISALAPAPLAPKGSSMPHRLRLVSSILSLLALAAATANAPAQSVGHGPDPSA